MFVFSQIFNTTQNFLILQNFVPCRSCQFWAKFSILPKHNSKFLDFAKFHLWYVPSGQNSQHVWILPGFVKNLFFEPNFQYCQSTNQNFWILPNFIDGMSRVVKTLNFGLDFYSDWKFLNFTNFHLSHVLNGQKCQFWAKFLTRIKISSLAVQGWSNSWFQVKFTARLKISGLCQIPSSAGLEWSKISFLSQIFNATENFAKFLPLHVQSGQNYQFWA